MAPGMVSVYSAMPTAMTMSAGIMTRFAFSMPPFTPSDTTMNTMAMNRSIHRKLSVLLEIKPVKKSPPSASASGPLIR